MLYFYIYIYKYKLSLSPFFHSEGSCGILDCHCHLSPSSFIFFEVFRSKIWRLQKKHRTFAALEPAKPLIEAQMCGAFFICEKDYDMATTIPFTKTYTSPAHLVQLLKARGLSIHNNQKAEHYLQYIGYYRLSAYMYPLLNTKCRSTSSSPRHPSGK